MPPSDSAPADLLTLTLLEEALSQNDLRPLFEQELSRARRSTPRADPADPTRIR